MHNSEIEYGGQWNKQPQPREHNLFEILSKWDRLKNLVANGPV